MFSDCSDEELFIFARRGYYMAERCLYERHFANMKKYAYFSLFNEAAKIDDCDIETAFIASYLKAYTTFKRGNVRFLPFLLVIYKHELLKYLARAYLPTYLFNAVSMEANPVSNNHHSGLMMHDVVPAGEDPSSVKVYFSFLNTMNELGKLPKKLQGKKFELIRHLNDGYTFAEACKMEGFTYYQGCYIKKEFKAYIKKILSHENRVVYGEKKKVKKRKGKEDPFESE